MEVFSSMGRYSSIDCPVCKTPLENGEEIAVCPECGAPYHKKCYQATGHCIFPELHETGESWQAPRTAEETYDGSASLRCSRCATVNPPHGIFCQVCGNKLNDKPIDDQQADGTPGGWHTHHGFPGGMPLNPFTTPYGGVAPDEVIDEVPAKDLAIFTNRNSHYFLPRFKALANTRGKVINWSAFLFHGGYFLYRKMYLPAVIVLLFSVLLEIPNTLLSLLTLSEVTGLLDLPIGASEATLTNVSYVCSFLTLALRFICGFFANSLYFSRCKKKIAAERQIERSEDEYYAALAKKGGVATKLIIGLVVAYGILCMLSMYSTAWIISFL